VNFAAIGLHEAAAATGNATIADASRRLLEYLARIQQRSSVHPELDGAWMRAFDYEKWEVWASAADIGWGPWCVHSDSKLLESLLIDLLFDTFSHTFPHDQRDHIFHSIGL
jgi:hypothetical protein